MAARECWIHSIDIKERYVSVALNEMVEGILREKEKIRRSNGWRAGEERRARVSE